MVALFTTKFKTQKFYFLPVALPLFARTDLRKLFPYIALTVWFL